MKRVLVSVFALLFVLKSFSQDTTAVATKPAPKPASADDYTYDKFNFGLAVTPSINWLTPGNDYADKDGMKVGFAYGIVGDISFAQRYSFSTGVDIAYYGGKLKYSISSYDSLTGTTNVTIHDNYKLNYVNIPISIKMRTNKVNPKLAFFGQFGFVTGISTGAKASRSYSDGREDETVSLSKDATDVVFGLRVGAGTEYFLSGNTRAFAGLTWNQGFSQVIKGDFDSKSNYIALQLGIFF